MSFVVQIWAHPIPDTFEQAVQLASDLPRVTCPPQPAFRLLARQLTSRYPCITELDDDDPAAVWTDGPLDGVTDKATLGLGIVTEHLDEVLPFVIETATSMGLVVFDGQHGRVSLPQGTVLNREGRWLGTHLGVEVAGTFGAALVERTLRKLMLSVLDEVGFEDKTVMDGLWRSHERGTQGLRVDILLDSPERVVFDIELLLTDLPMKAVVESLLALAEAPQKQVVATAMGSMATCSRFFGPGSMYATRHLGGERFELESIDELRNLAIGLRWLLLEGVRSLLLACEDPRQLAHYVNSRAPTAGRVFEAPASGGEDGVFRNLLSTRRCGGVMVDVLLAGSTQDPTFAEVLVRSRAQVAGLPDMQYALESKKLEVCLKLLQDHGMV